MINKKLNALSVGCLSKYVYVHLELQLTVSLFWQNYFQIFNMILLIGGQTNTLFFFFHYKSAIIVSIFCFWFWGVVGVLFSM